MRTPYITFSGQRTARHRNYPKSIVTDSNFPYLVVRNKKSRSILFPDSGCWHKHSNCLHPLTRVGHSLACRIPTSKVAAVEIFLCTYVCWDLKAGWMFSKGQPCIHNNVIRRKIFGVFFYSCDKKRKILIHVYDFQKII